MRHLDQGTPGTPPVRWVLQQVGAFASIVDFEYASASGPDLARATLIGHEADPATLAVAAVNVDTLAVETFSSIGPSTFLFEPVRADGTAASALPSPQTVTGPAVAGVQRLPISFALTGTSATFAGTSAAAPTVAAVAAVAALAVQAAPGITPTALRAALMVTANAAAPKSPYDPAVIEPARVTGAGLVDAYALLTALAAPAPVPSPEPAAQPAGARTVLAASGTDAAPSVAIAIAAALLVLGAAALLFARLSRGARFTS